MIPRVHVLPFIQYLFLGKPVALNEGGPVHINHWDEVEDVLGKHLFILCYVLDVTLMEQLEAQVERDL